MFRIRLVNYFVLVCLVCCKEEVINRPVFETEAVSIIGGSGVLLNGKIIYIGSTPMEDYGFVWGITTEPDTADFVFYFHEKPVLGPFSKQVEHDLIPNSTYYVRSFLKRTTSITYGNPVKFQSLGSKGAVITDFTPKQGTSLTQITITGDYFNALPAKNLVKVGPVNCDVRSASRTQLLVQLPTVDFAGKFNITVEVYNNISTSSDFFTLTGPIISSFAPSSGAQGTSVVITGTGFSTNPADNLVYFGDAWALVTAASNTQLTAAVPSAFAAGAVDITVKVNHIVSIAPAKFTIEGPEITNFTPQTDYPGKTVTITGKNFSTIPAENYVTFGGWPATVLTASPSQLTVQIPYRLAPDPNGNYPVWINVTVMNISFMTQPGFTPLTPWTKLGSFPGAARYGAAGFSIGSLGYLGTGNAFSNKRDFWMFNPAEDTWTQKLDFPGPSRDQSFSFSLNGKGYIGGGVHFINVGDPSSAIRIVDFWEYDPQSDTWTRKQDFPSAPYIDYRLTGMAISSKGYVVVGSDLYEYDPSTDQWTKKPNPFPGKYVSGNVSFGLGSKGYSGLGVTSDGAKIFEFWEYEPSLDQWTRLPDYPGSESEGNINFTIDGKGYVGIGGPFSYSNTEFYRFDPSSNAWTRIPNVPGDRQAYAIGFEINGSGYFAIGSGSNEVYKLNPDF